MSQSLPVCQPVGETARGAPGTGCRRTVEEKGAVPGGAAAREERRWRREGKRRWRTREEGAILGSYSSVERAKLYCETDMV